MRWQLEARATRAYALKNYQRTRKLLTELLREVGENPHTLHMLSRCSEHLGEVDDALGYAERSLAADPNHFGSLQVMTQLHYKLGDEEAARAYAARALGNVPRYPPRLLGLRWWAGRLGRGDRARAAEVHPEDRRWIEWVEEHVLPGGKARG